MLVLGKRNDLIKEHDALNRQQVCGQYRGGRLKELPCLSHKLPFSVGSRSHPGGQTPRSASTTERSEAAGRSPPPRPS